MIKAKKVEIKVNTLNAIMSYLGKQPFQDVVGLINAVQEEAQPQLSVVPDKASNEVKKC